MKKIIVVDDEALIGKMLMMNLKAKGYDCESFVNGYDALDSLKSHSVDLVITDLMMPEIDGLMLTKKIHELYETLPVIFLSSNKVEAGIDYALTHGAKSYITKPFDMGKILEEVEQIIN